MFYCQEGWEGIDFGILVVESGLGFETMTDT